jgi:hypothetical protein
MTRIDDGTLIGWNEFGRGRFGAVVYGITPAAAAPKIVRQTTPLSLRIDRLDPISGLTIAVGALGSE